MPARSCDTVFRKRERIVTREIAGETLLVPIRGKLVDLQKIFSLDPVAAFIWERLDGAATLGDIRDAVVGAFEVEPPQADADVQEFVAELAAADLIEETS